MIICEPNWLTKFRGGTRVLDVQENDNREGLLGLVSGVLVSYSVLFIL